ncbi:hypothetical protein E1287_34610 [Actinomadura sp. KC06]|nr:hypothetical protein E1287_34610 [Actinomadura sp. KC06]
MTCGAGSAKPSPMQSLNSTAPKCCGSSSAGTSARLTICRDGRHQRTATPTLADLVGHQTCQHLVYRISCEEFEALWGRSRGRCEICGAPESEVPGSKLFIDHDRRISLCYAVRGILCAKCNSLMRYVDRGEKASAEAERYQRNAWHLTHPPTYYYAPHPKASPSAWRAYERHQARRNALGRT